MLFDVRVVPEIVQYLHLLRPRPSNASSALVFTPDDVPSSTKSNEKSNDSLVRDTDLYDSPVKLGNLGDLG
jgi:hypothetical protein